MTSMMRAAVAGHPGPPDVLRVREVPIPQAREGWTLIQVMAFGLNRSELMTRQGHSPTVRFPRVLGIECVGVVAESRVLPTGTRVAAVMGEMGRAFDGGYAEYALLPDHLLIPLDASLDWATLGALPETYLTAHGSLTALGAGEGGGTLLVRGATSSVGMAALSLAVADWKLKTIATTRNSAKAGLLSERGADHVVIDTGTVSNDVRKIVPAGPDYVLDLVGATTVPDSLLLVKTGGTVCVTGMLSGIWVIPQFEPVAMIPSGTKLTAFHSDDLIGPAGQAALQRVVNGIESGRYYANVDRVFSLDEVAEAHRYMEASKATGKVVVVTDAGRQTLSHNGADRYQRPGPSAPRSHGLEGMTLPRLTSTVRAREPRQARQR
jgi:NADPH:quinone reductase-like Zn-dependent oxidoreductase